MTKDTNDLPHDVPARELDAVLIRDGSHKGTLVTKLDDNEYRFDSLDAAFKSVTRERCVLVELADPELDEYGYELSDWQIVLPSGATVGCDLEGQGYALLGLDHGQEIDERCGTVLWDSDESDAVVPLVSPAEILREEFDRPDLAARVEVADKVTAELAAELAEATGTTVDFWLNLQAHYEE